MRLTCDSLATHLRLTCSSLVAHLWLTCDSLTLRLTCDSTIFAGVHNQPRKIRHDSCEISSTCPSALGHAHFDLIYSHPMVPWFVLHTVAWHCCNLVPTVVLLHWVSLSPPHYPQELVRIRERYAAMDATLGECDAIIDREEQYVLERAASCSRKQPIGAGTRCWDWRVAH